MTVLEIEVNGEKRTLYMDGRLYKNIQQKVIPKVRKRDEDWVWIVDGPERSGKSVFSFQLAKVLDPTFCLERVCMTPEEFVKAVLKAKKHQCVVFDEAFTGLSSRASLTEINRLLVSLMMEMGQKNLFIIIVMPTFFMLDRYVALFRAKGLFKMYMKKGKKGRWVYYNRRKKKELYLKGRKLLDYSQPKSHFRGRFLEQYTIPEQEYRQKKSDALIKKGRTTKSETYLRQRNILLYILMEKYVKNYTRVAAMCKEMEWNIDRTSIYDAIMQIKKEKIQEEDIEREKMAKDIEERDESGVGNAENQHQ